MQRLQHAEHVRLPVHRARLQVRRGQHQPPPRAGQQAGVDLGRADLLTAHQLRQRLQRGQHRQALRGGAEVDHLDQTASGTAARCRTGSTSIARHASSASESSGGASSNSAAIAAASSWRGTTSSIRSHIAARRRHLRRADLPGVGVDLLGRGVEHDLERGRQPVTDARSTRGSVFSFSFAVSRSARASSFVAISTSSRSSASSTARSSGTPRWPAASPAAARRCAGAAAYALPSTRTATAPPAAAAVSPTRPARPSRTRRSPPPAPSAHFICGPEIRTGPRRSRSSSETRAPGGTVSSESSTARCPVLSSPYRLSHSRWFAASRTEATSRASGSPRAAAPGARAATRPPRRTTPSAPPRSSTPARPPTPATRLATSAKSALLPASLDLPGVRQRAVPSRSPYSFSTEASAMPSCSARYSTTSAGTCRGSSRNHPEIPHGRELDREAQPVVRPPLGLHQLPVRVVQEEEPLQLRTGRRPVRTPRTRRLAHPSETRPAPRPPKIDNTTAKAPLHRRSRSKRLLSGQPLAHDLTRMFLKPRTGRICSSSMPYCG